MIYFKDIITHERVTLKLYDVQNKVAIVNKNGLNVVLLLEEFHKQYEYVWMSH